MSSSFFAQDARPEDAVMAALYERITANMRQDAQCYLALANAVVEDEDNYGTFSRAYAALLQRAYTRMAAEVTEVADQAASIARDYRAHSDGTYVPLDVA